MPDIGAMYLDEAFRSLRGIKRQADSAMAQLSDEQFFAVLDAESNSVAIIVKHMAGNMRSRFTDFLTSDGEKPDRNRDQEFIVAADASRSEIMATWEKYWQLVFDTVKGLSPDDLSREVTIRREPHTVLQAINRQVAHYALHTGQIIFLAKHWTGAAVEDAERPARPERCSQRRITRQSFNRSRRNHGATSFGGCTFLRQDIRHPSHGHRGRGRSASRAYRPGRIRRCSRPTEVRHDWRSGLRGAFTISVRTDSVSSSAH